MTALVVAQVADLTEALAAMTSERDHYMRELGLVRSRDDEARVSTKLGLSKYEAIFLMTLYARRTRTVSLGAMMEALYGDQDREPGDRILKCWACKVRKKIGGDKIRTHFASGYSITQTGVELVEQALRVGAC